MSEVDAGATPVHRRLEQLREAAARNLAGRHEASVRALGFRTADWDDAWAALEPIPPLYLRWVGKRAPADDEATAQLERLGRCLAEGDASSLSDPWHVLDPTALDFVRGDDHPWMVRDPGEAEIPPTAAELEIVRVSDVDTLREFATTSLAGFGAPPLPPLSIYAPATLADPRFFYFLGRVDGRGVSTATAFVHAGVVGVYDVATLHDARRRGYGTALTVRAMLADPSLPSVLQPSAMGESTYRRLGYERFTSFATWYRPAR